MAILNKKEKLILSASKKEDPFLTEVFDEMLSFFILNAEIETKSYLDIIDYLYFRNHRHQTFKRIADDVLHLGLSTLEDRRKDIIKIFYKVLEGKMAKRQIAGEAAATKANKITNL